jgi:hypothetical protein
MTLLQDSRGKIPCKPDFKVVEDEVMIVGILTETNQFVELSPPEPLVNVSDSIKIFNSNNYLIADKETLVTGPIPKIDEKRVEYITKLKLETNFLNVFRNSIRILLNEYENLSIRENIEELANSIGDLYKYKLRQITLLLQELVKDKIKFSEDYNYNMINEITTCIIQKPDKCEANKPLCALINDGNTCQLVLPKTNLLNGTDNKKTYFVKMADEIIRYNRIKSFLFKPQSFASFSSLNYNLRENEIIVIQSMLNQEYFDGLVPIETNQFIKYNTYDNVQPIKTQTYTHQLDLDEAINPEESQECVVKNNAMISSVFWRKVFPKGFGEYEYPDSKVCTFNMVIDVIKRTKGKEYSIAQIRGYLENEYKKYIDVHKDAIINVLIEEGKKTLGDQLKAGTLTFSNLFKSESYFLTHFDLWLLLNAAQIPSIFISIKQNITYNNVKQIEVRSFLCYGEPEDKFVFIVVPAFAPEKVPTYRVINDKETGNVTFSLGELNEGEGFTDLNKSLENRIGVLDYLSRFQRKPVPQNSKAAKKQKAKLVIQEEPEPESELAPALEPDLPSLIKETERKVPQVSRVVIKKTRGQPKEKKQETKRAKSKPKLKIVEKN